MSGGDHFLPLFVGDFLASTATWTGPERGLYLQLLMCQWSAGELPCDLHRLARAVNYEFKEFTALWPIMKSKFRNGDGRLSNPRVEEVRRKNRESQANRKHASMLGVEKRRELGMLPPKDEPAVEPSVDPRIEPKVTPDIEPLVISKVEPHVEPMVNHSDPIRSESDPKPNQSKKKTKNTTAAARPTVPTEFEDLKAIYPERSGGNPWPRALKACHARIRDGCSWNDMLDGARRYQNFCRETGKIGTEYVMQAATFFGPDRRFLEAWDLPATKADALRDANIKASQDWLNGTE